MAASNPTNYPLGSPQQHTETCELHKLPIDMNCEDCKTFICNMCAKRDHRDHDWKPLTSSATERRRGLGKFLEKIKEEDLSEINEEIEKIKEQLIENKDLCAVEISKVQNHFHDIGVKLKEVKERFEKKLKDNLVEKNCRLEIKKSDLDQKKKRIVDMVEFLKKNNSTMSDYSLIDNHRELTKLLSELEIQTANREHSVRFIRGEINNNLPESLVGYTLDLDDMGVTEIDSFQLGDKEIPVSVLETISEDQCYVLDKSKCVKVKLGPTKKKNVNITVNANDICLTANSYVYFTDSSNKTIRFRSSSGSFSTVNNKDPLEPLGICQSVDGRLLVTFKDNESDPYKLESHSRRLVRHITLTGDVIHEYEYQEDGQTRLFTLPLRVTQNRNSDICVVDEASLSTANLVGISPSGQRKFLYLGRNLSENFKGTDVACDSLCNIPVTDINNKHIHLLSPDGEFLKFLLTENEMKYPRSLSLYKSTLWVGNNNGFVKVFRYK
ncbi:uncharacterized protein LOC134281946 [Saccostrea cucullata]|uniref:uncharacterized protein LOC134281946 n=1 Tax=Saccostrea cuccullata TaxID=36930 RepID=UPI002ED67492